MNNLAPLINGKSYEWSDITMNVMGVPIVGVTAIKYDERNFDSADAIRIVHSI